MSTRVRRRVVSAVLGVNIGILVVLALIVVRGGEEDSSTASGSGPGGVSVGPAIQFTVGGGSAAPISPGVSVPLDLSITNHNDVPSAVSRLSVRVAEVSAPNADDGLPCGVEDFSVDEGLVGSGILVEARAAATLSSLGVPSELWPQVGMLDADHSQDGCKGATLTLAYAGCAVPAGTPTAQADGGSGRRVPIAAEGADRWRPRTRTAALGTGIGAANACQDVSVDVHSPGGR